MLWNYVSFALTHQIVIFFYLQPSPEGGTGLRRYIEQLRLQLEGRDVTLIVQGLEKYFK